MASLRTLSRLFPKKSFSTTSVRNYADEMKFTFAAGNQVKQVVELV